MDILAEFWDRLDNQVPMQLGYYQIATKIGNFFLGGELSNYERDTGKR